MGKVKQIEIKNWSYYFYNGIINIEEFDSNLLKIDKKSYKDIYIYYIGYITIKKIADCENRQIQTQCKSFEMSASKECDIIH